MAQDKTTCQMPLYMLYTWGWTKLFRSSQWSFHLANLPWFVAGAAAFPVISGRRPAPAHRGLVVLFSPLPWYYLGRGATLRHASGRQPLVVASLRRLPQGGCLANAQDAVRWRCSCSE